MWEVNSKALATLAIVARVVFLYSLSWLFFKFHCNYACISFFLMTVIYIFVQNKFELNWINFKPETLELHFSQLIPVES